MQANDMDIDGTEDTIMTESGDTEDTTTSTTRKHKKSKTTHRAP
jgi:hypothetical protein